MLIRSATSLIRPASAAVMLAALAWATVAPAATFSRGEGFRDFLRSGELGPEMVVVPAGRFLMGDLSGDGMSRERPVREVTISRPFAIGKHEITFADYQRFLGPAAPPADEGWGRGNRPVINVSWTEAVAYVSWLSAQTGQHYRLPSEAEWEYAARAGTTTAFSWGDDVGESLANCANCGSPPWGGRQSAPVGSFPANPWGLFDMHGNVWEWVRDCAHENYVGAPSDGSAWEVGDCAKRVVRGGAFDFGATDFPIILPLQLAPGCQPPFWLSSGPLAGHAGRIASRRVVSAFASAAVIPFTFSHLTARHLPQSTRNCGLIGVQLGPIGCLTC